MVDFRAPEKLVGSNTVGSIQSGLYYGFIGLIDGIVERIAAQLGPGHQGRRHRGAGAVDCRWLAAGEDLRRRPDARRTAAHLGAQSSTLTENYFNYFTEIEDHFQRARGTGLFLLSPLDWALIEAWKNAGIPLEAVLRGIDQAFDKWRSRPPRGTPPDGEFAGLLRAGDCGGSPGDGGRRAPRNPPAAAPPFSLEDVRAYIARNAAALRKAGSRGTGGRRSKHCRSKRSTAIWSNWSSGSPRIEEKMIARLRSDAERRSAF